MSFSLTTASDIDDLLGVIKTFAVTTDSWTADYDDIAGAGGSGAQLGISKGNCFLSIGVEDSVPIVAETDEYNGGTVDDAFLFMVVNHSLNASNKFFWGHPSSIVTTAGDADRIRVNDLAGEGSDFVNVWLFSGAAKDFVWVVTQQGGDRFTVFGFGVLDKKGMSHPDVAFCVGHDYTWWPDDASPSGGGASWTDPAAHDVGFFGGSDGDAENAMIMLKDKTVDPALGFTDGDFQMRNLQRVMSIARVDTEHEGESDEGFMLDYFAAVSNQSVTGGETLSGISCLPRMNNFVTFVGEYPDIRFVDMTNLVPGQTIKRGAEEWLVFPMKRKGTQAATKVGGAPLPFVNSWKYGFAIKKTV